MARRSLNRVTLHLAGRLPTLNHQADLLETAPRHLKQSLPPASRSPDSHVPFRGRGQHEAMSSTAVEPTLSFGSYDWICSQAALVVCPLVGSTGYGIGTSLQPGARARRQARLASDRPRPQSRSATRAMSKSARRSSSSQVSARGKTPTRRVRLSAAVGPAGVSARALQAVS